MTRPTKFGIFVGVFALCLGMAGCRSETTNKVEPAPAISFKLIDGQVLPLRDFAGRVLLVDFWATSCAICLAEMPSIHAMATSMASDGLSIVTVAMPYDRPDHVLHAVQTRGIKLPVALDIRGDVVKALGPVNGTPTRVLIDRRGNITARMSGAMNPSRLRARLRQLLDQPLARGQGDAS